MDTQAWAGRCLCGGLRYRALGPWRHLCHCHCESCRRAAGAPSVAWGTVERAHFSLLQGQLRIVRSSPPVERGFCADCGTTISYAHAERAGDLDLSLASLEDPSALAPQAHIWVQDKLPWVRIDDGLPQFPQALAAHQSVGL